MIKPPAKCYGNYSWIHLHTSSQARQLNDSIILWASLPLKKCATLPFYPGELRFWSGASAGRTQGYLQQGTQANPLARRYTREPHNGVTPRRQPGATITALLNSFSVPLRALGGQMIPLLFLFLSNLILLQGPTICLTLYEIDYMDFI